MFHTCVLCGMLEQSFLGRTNKFYADMLKAERERESATGFITGVQCHVINSR